MGVLNVERQTVGDGGEGWTSRGGLTDLSHDTTGARLGPEA